MESDTEPVVGNEVKPIEEESSIRQATLEEVAERMSPKIQPQPSEPELAFWEIIILLSIIGVSLFGILTGLKVLGWI